MKAAVEGKIRATSQGAPPTVLKSGYLLKKGSGLRREWARRFFEVDSAGMLDYCSSKVPPPPPPSFRPCDESFMNWVASDIT